MICLFSFRKFFFQKGKVFLSTPLEHAHEIPFFRGYQKIKSYFPIDNAPNLEYFRDYLVQNSNIYPSLFLPEKITPSCTNNSWKLLNEFKTNCEDDAPALKEINNALKEELRNMSENELLTICHLFANSSFTCEKKSILEIVKTIDDEIIQNRLPSSVDFSLKLSDALFPSKFFLIFNSVWKRLEKFCYKLSSLSPNQIVHLAYLLSKFSLMPAKENKFKFQDVLNVTIPKLNVNEIGLICFALRKMKLIISHPDIYSKALDIVLANIENINDPILFSLSQALWGTGSATSLKSVVDFQERIIPHINKFNMASLTSLALSGLVINKVSSPLVSNILNKAKENISGCGLLDLVRLIFIMANFNIKDDEFLNLAVEEVRSREITNSFNLLIPFTTYMLCLGVFNEDLIKKVLSEKYVLNVLKQGCSKIHKFHLGFIDQTIHSFMPHYESLKLNENQRKKIWKTSRSPKTLQNREFYSLSTFNNENIINKMEINLTNLYGSEMVAWKKVIYFEQPTIIMRFDRNLIPQTIPEEFKVSKGLICEPLNDDHIWAALILLSDFNFGLDKEIDFISRARIRCIEKIGYKSLPLICTEVFSNLRINNIKNFFENEVQIHLGPFRA